MTIIINIKYIFINNFILIMSQNALKPLHNQDFYLSNFFLEKALRFNGLRAISPKIYLRAGYDTNELASIASF